MNAEPSPARQDACRRCGVHKAHAQPPLRITSAGWMCGYCVMQIALIADYADELHASAAQAPAAEAPPPRPAAATDSTVTAAGAALLRVVGRDPVSETDIIAATGLPRSNVKRALAREIERGTILRIDGPSAWSPARYMRP